MCLRERTVIVRELVKNLVHPSGALGRAEYAHLHCAQLGSGACERFGCGQPCSEGLPQRLDHTPQPGIRGAAKLLECRGQSDAVRISRARLSKTAAFPDVSKASEKFRVQLKPGKVKRRLMG